MPVILGVVQQQIVGSDPSFVTSWTVTDATEADRTITLPLIAVSGHSHNFVVNWGDGSANDTITSHTHAARVHTYATAGDYTVTITGAMPGWSFNNGGDRLKIRNISNWGQVGFKTTGVANAFYGCQNMTCTATDTPDTSAVTNMSGMFRSASAFNGAIGGWNTANVTNMSDMFNYASAFNGAIGAWNTANVANMTHMFYSASAFNQDIGNWNVAKVENMLNMFYNCPIFDQNLGQWNVSAVTTASGMFNGASGDLRALLSPENYDALLLGWSALPTLQPNVAFHAGKSKYTAAGLVGRNILTGAPNNWVISGDGPVI